MQCMRSSSSSPFYPFGRNVTSSHSGALQVRANRPGPPSSVPHISGSRPACLLGSGRLVSTPESFSLLGVGYFVALGRVSKATSHFPLRGYVTKCASPYLVARCLGWVASSNQRPPSPHTPCSTFSAHAEFPLRGTSNLSATGLHRSF